MAADIVQLGRQRIDFRADHGAGFIHQVDRLVGQETVCNVPIGKGGGRDQGGVLDLDAVEDLIALLQSPEDGNGILHGRLLDHDRLETALQRGVLLNILPVFIQCGRTDAVQLAAGQHRFEQVAGIHRAVCLSGADDGVQLIDEENDPAVALFDLRQDGLEPFLKFTAEFGAGDQAAHIQGENGFVLQAVRHIPADNPEGQAFRNRGFADTRFTDQHGVVLRFPGKDPDDVPDFAVTADHRVQLLLPGHLNQVGSVFFQRVIGFLRTVRSDPCGAADLAERLQERIAAVAGGFQCAADPRGRPGAQAEPYMFHGQVFILHLLRGAFRLQERFFGILGEVHVGRSGAGRVRHPAEGLLQRAPERLN